MKKAIAMACTEEQWQSIKPKLEYLNPTIGNFNKLGHLTNYFYGKENHIGNVYSYVAGDYKREIHETWNEKVFLEACGIETEPEYVITESQIKRLHTQAKDEYGEGVCNDLKEWFPDALKKDKVELEYGRWICDDEEEDWIMFFVSPAERYGLCHLGWVHDKNDNKVSEYIKHEGNRYATPQEITEALKNEAVKRGFIDGVSFKILNGEREAIHIKNKSRFGYDDFENKLLMNGWCIFLKGKWTKPIETITKEDAEKELGKKIV